MLLPVLIIAIAYGLVLGSFANVLVLRDDRRKTIFTGRSQCPQCQKYLAWYELIPVVSFFIQGGRCRGCGKEISWQYPAVETGSALLVFFTFALFQDWSVLSVAFFAIGLLLALVYSVIDARTQEVPIDYVVLSGIFGATARVLEGASVYQLLLALAVGLASIQLVRLAWWAFRREEGMGSGDAWIAGSLAMFVGYPNILVMLFLAVTCGAVVGIALLVRSHQNLKGAAMPFGPFLFAGALLALVWGESLLRWYTNGLGVMY